MAHQNKMKNYIKNSNIIYTSYKISSLMSCIESKLLDMQKIKENVTHNHEKIKVMSEAKQIQERLMI